VSDAESSVVQAWREAKSLAELEVRLGGTAPLDQLLDTIVGFLRRYIVVTDIQADTIAVWIAHTYVVECFRATPYLNFCSPEMGSGKTTALEVLEVTSRGGLTADDLTGAALFRLVEKRRPTLLIDEVDGVFGKQNSDTAQDLRKLLNSGYRQGKRVFRMGGPQRDELKEFDPFSAKATAGLNELPGTLAHRSIPIAMQPPRPDELYEDFDPEEAEEVATKIRLQLDAWAREAEGALRDPRLKPAKLPELDARGNEIWRPLLRVADQAGGRWPEAIRNAARELSGGDRRRKTSVRVQLLGDVQQVDFPSDEKISCRALADALNELEDAPWGAWNDGKGITTRELGKKFAPYGILARSMRGDDWRGNGYERAQFEDAWARYIPVALDSNRDTVTTRMNAEESDDSNHDTDEIVTVSREASNPHGKSDVTVVTVSNEGNGVRSLSEQEKAVLRDRVAREELERQDEERRAADERLKEEFQDELDLGTASLEQIHRANEAGLL
jgi:hypothetical protein